MSVPKSEVLKTIQEVDEFISKAQILRGGDSERRQWAGSSWEDQDIPDYAPNGTDYDPSKNVKRATNKKPFKKSVDDMTEEELERELALRKSGYPNPVLAEAEILENIEGVEKAICPTCNGSSHDAISKSQCGQCFGYGFCFVAPNAAAAEQIDAIAKKYNVGADPNYFEKAQKKNKGGGTGESDTTGNPTQMESLKEDFTGEKVFKGFDDLVEKMTKMEGQLDAMNQMTKGDLEEEVDMGDQLSMEGEDDAPEMEKSQPILSASFNTIMDAQKLILKGLRTVLNTQATLHKGVSSIAKGQADIADLTATSVEVQGSVLKSLLTESTSVQGEEINKSQNATPQPARGPQAAGHGLRILKKGFGDNPDSGLADDNSPKYDFETIKKGAVKMVLDRDLIAKNQINRRIVIGLEQNILPNGDDIKKIERYIDQNGID